MFRIICLLIGYFFGMFQTSYFMGKLSGIDIREHGSKNAGFTNTNRVLGFRKGIVVFLIDVGKAMAAFAVATVIYNNFLLSEASSFSANAGGTFFESSYVLPGLYAGLGVVLGHCFPFFLKFKGGKGVSSTLGLIIMLDWRVAIISFAIGIAIVFFTRYISVASMTIVLSVTPLLFFFFRRDHGGFTPVSPVEMILLTAGLCVFIWFLHRANIQRLIAGEENKFSFSRGRQ